MDDPPRTKASFSYLLKTALLAGVAGAMFSWLAARLLGVSATIAAIAGGVAMALMVGGLIHRHGRPENG